MEEIMPTLNTFKYKQDIQDKSITIAPSCLSCLTSDIVELSFHLNLTPDNPEYFSKCAKATSYLIDFKFHILSFELKFEKEYEKFLVAKFKKIGNPYITLDKGFRDLDYLNDIEKIKFFDYEIIVDGNEKIIINIQL